MLSHTVYNRFFRSVSIYPHPARIASFGQVHIHTKVPIPALPPTPDSIQLSRESRSGQVPSYPHFRVANERNLQAEAQSLPPLLSRFVFPRPTCSSIPRRVSEASDRNKGGRSVLPISLVQKSIRDFRADSDQNDASFTCTTSTAQPSQSNIYCRPPQPRTS